MIPVPSWWQLSPRTTMEGELMQCIVTGAQERLRGLRRFGVRDPVGPTSRLARQIPEVAPAERGATTWEGRK
jgi:hypothetical protein